MLEMHHARILLIDDRQTDNGPVLRMLITNGLARHLLHLQAGDEMLHYLSQLNNRPRLAPDLVLIDLALPKASVSETLLALKENKHLKKVPVLALTSLSTQQDLHDYHAPGVVDHLRKPVSFGDFAQAMVRIGLARILAGTSYNEKY